MVGRCGGGPNTLWADWSPEGREARDNIIREFMEGMDEACGHFTKLEESVLKEGFRNPIIVTCNTVPRRHGPRALPPELRNQPEVLIAEGTTGGSRLWAAQKHDMVIPVIINDWLGNYRHCPEMRDEDDLLVYYTDPPKEGFFFGVHHGLMEKYDRKKVGSHLSEEWSEDKLMDIRVPLWLSLMDKYGREVKNLPDVYDKYLKGDSDE